MKIVSILTAFVGFAAGIFAAWYWYKSTQIAIPDVRRLSNGNVTIDYTEWMDSAVKAIRDGSDLNKQAAIATAISVLANGVAVILSTYFVQEINMDEE